MLAALVAAGLASVATARPLSVERVAPGIYVHRGVHEDFRPANRGGIANLGFVVGDEAVLVVDAGGSYAEGRDWVEAIRRVTDLPIRYLVLTHVHPDHIFGARALVEAGATVVLGHRHLPRAMADKGPIYARNMERLLGDVFKGSELVAPTRTVDPKHPLQLDLGHRMVELRAWATAHTDTDLTLFDAATATLFAGDLLFMERLPVVDGSLLGWLRVMDEMAKLPARRVVPGHGPARAPWPEALIPQRRYLQQLRDRVRALLRQGVSLAEAPAAVPPPQGWLLVDPNHGRNVVAAYTELEWED